MFIFPMPPALSTENHGIPIIRHKPVNEQPHWMTPEGLHTLKNGYLLDGETPWGMYKRVANAAASRINRPDLAPIFFSLMWNGWLGAATPVLSNMGTDRGLPISCNSISVSDSLHGIFSSVKELAHLSSKGAGVGVYIGDVRARGESISTGGYSEGVIPWCKVFDSATIATSQGQTRRGATAMYLPFKHKDIREFLRMRRPLGDENQRCMNIHHAVCIDDDDMEAIRQGNKEAVEIYNEILKTRKETGEPYIFYTGNVNNPDVLPIGYLNNQLTVKGSNICLLGEELVITLNGPKQIKDLVGKTVTIWDGEEWVQNNSFEYKGHTNQLAEVTFRDGSKIKTTLNHRFPTEAFGFVEAKDLKHGMTVKTHTIQYSGDVELEGAYLKGFLAADGTSHNGKPILWLYDTKYMCQERILSEVNALPIDENCNDACITEAGIKAAGENRVSVLGLTARKLSLYPWCKEYKKQLPENYLDWTFISKVEFLAGLFDGDGTVVHNSFARCYQLASIHKGFLEQVQLLLKSLGVYSSLNCMRIAGKTDFNDGYGEYNTVACYRLTISNSSAYKLADVCHFSRLPKLERPTKRGAYNTKPTHGKVQKIEIIDVEPTPTYCTHVPSTHEFALADGRMTGNCSEITGYLDALHSFVCCLSSMNLARWDEWKNTKAIYYAIWFLEGVIQEYIDKAKHMVGFENAVRFAEKSRMLGLGVLGYHTLLQQKMIPFESYQARLLNKVIFGKLADETNKASKDLAKIYGEPEWCKGTGLRHTHTIALAPTVSNSMICGHVSAGIEPLAANCFEKRGAKGVILYYNPIFKQLLADRGKDTVAVWDSIIAAKGSVQHLGFLSDEEKEVFLTAREINQMEIINQAADRQKLMDKHRQGQAQSVNLFFTKDVDETYFTRVHYQAWKKGLKTLYYCRSESASQADLPSRTQQTIGKLSEGGAEECLACHG